MLSRFYKPVLLISLVVLLVAMAGRLSCTQSAPKPLRVGYLLGDLHHLPLFVALDQGFFKDEGIDVQIVGPFDAGPAEMDALASNQLDMGYVGLAPAVLAAARKVELSIISGVNQEGSGLAVEKNINSVADLKSKKVATPAPGSIQYVMMGMLLSNNKMTFQDLDLFPGTIKPPDMPGALQTGRISGYFVWEPYVAKSVVSGTGKVLIESKDIWPGHPCCVVVTRNDFASKNANTVATVLRVHQRAIKFIADNPAEAKIIAAKFTKLDAATIDEAFKRVIYTSTLNKDDVKRFMKEIMSLGETGVIKPIITSADVPDIDAFVNRVVNLK